jgi:hypothetical protein
MSPSVSVIDEAQVRSAVGRPERVRSAAERWREAVDQILDAPDEVKRAVGDYCIHLPDRSAMEVVAQLNQVFALAEAPLLLREVSARLFWGMSKVLDKRQALVAALLGAPECPFPESPMQLQVHVPAGGHAGVLFIENQVSFEQALRSTARASGSVALVYAAGFKGSAQRLRRREGCSVYYSGRGALDRAVAQRFEAWLFEDERCDGERVHFWGDLDDAGMCILAAMRASFPGVTAWEPGYAPMLAALLAGQGHAPEAADKAGQRPVAATGCPYADAHLLPALARLRAFVDQELFSL